MGKGTTAIERFKERRRLAGMTLEERAINPLEVNLSEHVTLDTLDWRDLDFQVSQFRVVTRHIGDRDFPMVDYYLRHRGLEESDEVRCVLRFMPLDEPDPDAGRTHQVFLMQLVAEHAHDDAVVDVLAANQGYVQYLPNPDYDPYTEHPAKQWMAQEYPGRVDDIEAPYDCSVELLRDTDGDGKVETEEVENFEITLWDFWRSTTTVFAGVENEPEIDFLFVEIERKDGWTDIFTAEVIDPAIVTKL